MLKDIKQLLEGSRYTIAIAFTILICFLSLAPISSTMEVIDVSDKTLHTFAYFVLSTSWIFAINRSRDSLRLRLIVGLGVLLLSVLLEIFQGSLTDYRTTDNLDIVANTLGIIFAIVSFRYLLRLYNTI